MPLEEYSRKRRFAETPEPGPRLPAKPGHRFVVQKHRASRLHYDFRIEMQGVLKSWAVPKGPSLDPADKRLAMMVEDHPVSYFHFEGIIPPGNYGAGTVMVWDTGVWEPLFPEGAPRKKLSAAARETYAAQMLEKGDFKFQLSGQKLNGDFVLARMRSRRPGSKGTEWLLIKKRDKYVQEGYNIEAFDSSALTDRSLKEIAGDQDAAEWQSSRKATRSAKNDWLADSIRKKRAADVKKNNRTAEHAESAEKHDFTAESAEAAQGNEPKPNKKLKARKSASAKSVSATNDSSANSAISAVSALKGAVRAPMLHEVHPMLATLVDAPFDDPAWLFEIKWDGYRALAFIERGKLRLVSRNQNQFGQYPELGKLPQSIQAKAAILDGEIVALDERGRSSFSLMQERNSGFGRGRNIPVLYYAFDLLYLDGYSLLRVDLEQRKQLLRQVLKEGETLRYSDHYLERGSALYAAARERGLEGIVAKRRASCYLPKRSRDWLKLKVTQQQECVIGGYTDPRGAREHFGSLVLGLYDEKKRLIPVGQAGSGFTEQTHAAVWKRLHALEAERSPFFGKPESPRGIHYLRPELVAEIKFSEWTHEGKSGAVRMRAPIYLGLREDKKPEDCVFEFPRSTEAEVKKAESGDAA